MNFGRRTPEAESHRIIDRALEAGLRVLDTANAYNDGDSERIVGRALARLPPSLRAEVQVHTKCGFGRANGGKPEGLTAPAIRRAVEGSLERLGVERLDVYYLHVPDRATPIEETLGAMAELHRDGKIAGIGVSNYGSWEILEMFAICDRLGAPRPSISQVIYNVLVRQIEIEYLRFAARYGVHTTVYNPLAGGLLARAQDLEKGPEPGSRFATNKLYTGRYWTPGMHAAAAALRDASEAHGVTSLELAYAWLRDRPGVDSVIVGPATVAHLDAAVAAWQRKLPPELLARADEIHAGMVATDARYAR
jgi:aryl-alcohol dehydrogenase-like predicted oxidoreductase